MKAYGRPASANEWHTCRAQKTGFRTPKETLAFEFDATPHNPLRRTMARVEITVDEMINLCVDTLGSPMAVVHRIAEREQTKRTSLNQQYARLRRIKAAALRTKHATKEPNQ